MKIAYRFVAVFLVVVVVSGAVLFVTFDVHRADVADNAEATVKGQATLSAALLDDRIREQRRTVTLAAANGDVAAHGTERQRDALADFLERSAFDGVSVVDETGTVRWIETTAGTDPYDLVGEDFGDRTYVRRALDGDRYVSDPLRAETENEVVVISAPLYDDGRLVGTINGAYHLDETDLFEPLSGDDRTAVTVEANGGETILFSDADRFEETISADATLGVVDWTITSHLDSGAVSEEINRLVLFQIVSGIALLGSITTFGVWVYRSKVVRIGRLRDRVRALERREYDGGSTIGGGAEWARIDGALDRLSTALARREQMLLVLNRILRHNLRNSLNVVSARATDLEATLDDPAADSAREIRAATADLLDLADRARRTELLLDPVDEPSRIDVADLVRERVDAFADDLGAEVANGGRAGEPDRTEVTITVSAPETAAVRCDGQLSFAIDELLANVADHAGPAPTATVSVGVADDVVRVRVEDDGPGIPPEEAMVITGDRDITQVTHTGGIGLWLVDWIVSRHGGRLLIPPTGTTTWDEDGLGGAVVILELPRASDEDSNP